MILISHRGNIDGIDKSLENNPFRLDEVLSQGYDVEIDLWRLSNQFYLGHDLPEYKIDLNWVLNRKNKLWVHCKNKESFEFFLSQPNDVNFFWHNDDDYTFTSKGFVIARPGKCIPQCISMIPELYDEEIGECTGICSDDINRYKNYLNL